MEIVRLIQTFFSQAYTSISSSKICDRFKEIRDKALPKSEDRTSEHLSHTVKKTSENTEKRNVLIDGFKGIAISLTTTKSLITRIINESKDPQIRKNAVSILLKRASKTKSVNEAREIIAAFQTILTTENIPEKISTLIRNSLKEHAMSAPQDDIKMSALQILINTAKSAQIPELREKNVRTLQDILDNLIQNTEITPHKIHSLKELAISAPQDDIKMSALQTLINTVKSAKTIEVKKEVILALRGILVSPVPKQVFSSSLAALKELAISDSQYIIKNLALEAIQTAATWMKKEELGQTIVNTLQEILITSNNPIPFHEINALKKIAISGFQEDIQMFALQALERTANQKKTMCLKQAFVETLKEILYTQDESTKIFIYAVNTLKELTISAPQNDIKTRALDALVEGAKSTQNIKLRETIMDTFQEILTTENLSKTILTLTLNSLTDLVSSGCQDDLKKSVQQTLINTAKSAQNTELGEAVTKALQKISL